MFMGHYGVSFAVKSADQRIPLWLLFIAGQFLDVLWGPLVLAGVEKVRIVPGITASLPLDLYYIPYTHSLVAAVAWSGVAALGYGLVTRRALTKSLGPAIWVGAAAFSHWILDLVVHRPDLSLYADAHKMGFGLWNYPIPALLLETAFLAAGLALYLRSTRGTTLGGRYGMILFGVVIWGVHVLSFFGPFLYLFDRWLGAAGPYAVAVTFLSTYLTFATIAGRLEKKRNLRTG